MDRARPRVHVLAAHLDPLRVRKPLAEAGWGVAPARAEQKQDAGPSGALPSRVRPPASCPRPAFMTAAEAVADIKDGSWLVVSEWEREHERE
jgi:hypothetical protein